MTQPNDIPWPGSLPSPPPPPEPPRKRNWFARHKILTGLGAVFALIVVVGVAAGSAINNTTTVTAPAPTPTGLDNVGVPQESLPAEPTTQAPDSNPGTAAVGEVISYENGVKVQVVSVRRVSFSDISYGSNGSGVAAVVKITNGAGEVLDLSLADVELTYGADGQQSEQVYDTEKGFNGGLDTKLANGRSATAKYGFAVPKGATTVSVQVTPDFGSETAIFEGRVS